MVFTAPMPWEADKFYAQPGFTEKNLSLNYWPVGTGPYMLTEYQENRRHVLERNPNFGGETYPCEGEAADRAAKLLDDCGKPLPLIDRVVFNIEKERDPAARPSSCRATTTTRRSSASTGCRTSSTTSATPTRSRSCSATRGIQMPRTLEISNWYVGFNWLDPGRRQGQDARGAGPQPQAAAGAVDRHRLGGVRPRVREQGGGRAGDEPGAARRLRLPAGQCVNPVVYDVVDGKPRRKSIDEAKRLLAEAGYPDGRDAKTGKPLVLNYDYQRALTPELKAEVEWMARQFAKINVQLEIRATDYNRFQDKAEKGSLQIFWWGWFADYPDAENFLFLLYGPNSKALTGGNGENAANYSNPEFDKLFDELKYLDDGERKQQVIDRMVAITQQDAPWTFGYNPYVGSVNHQWVGNVKPGPLVNDRLMYMKVDPALRAAKIAEWNRPVWWPVALMALALVVAVLPACSRWKRRERETAAPPARGRGALTWRATSSGAASTRS